MISHVALSARPSSARTARKHCRVCEGERLERFLNLGRTPLANAFLPTPSLADERRYRLDVHFCHDCGHVQLVNVVPARRLFRHYLYVSSTSPTLRRHFESLADDLIERQRPWLPNDLAVEIASNDGVLQKAFRERGVRCVGVEPAANVAAVARADGLEVIGDFFNGRTARRLRAQLGPARIITGSNVLGHVDQLRDFVAGLAHLVADDGIVCIEVPHLLALIEGGEFDTIYHEHLSYMSLRVLQRLFAAAGLNLFDVRSLPVHGGSIRVYARKTGLAPPASERLLDLLAAEVDAGLDDPETFRRFAGRVEATKQALVTLLRQLKAQGHRIAAYGAAAKGNTLLNYCGIGRDLVDYIVDRSPLKQGLFAPGTGLPVYPVEHLAADRPDYLLILAWNFADEIIDQQADYCRRGGRFILPLPELRIIDAVAAPTKVGSAE